MGCWSQTIRLKVLLIDAHNLAFRAYYAMSGLRTRSGVPTNALYGFIVMLLSVVEKLSPDYVYVAFDLPEPTFRHKQFPDYKGTREKAPDDFRVQVPLIREFVEKAGFTIVEKPGFEADDVIGTIATRASQQSPIIETYMYSGDRDVLQLVSEHVFALLPQKGIADPLPTKPEDVVQKFGLYPEQIVDYKALKGDSSDNIPGVRGIGDKTAVTLLQTYKTLDNLYENLDKVTPEGVRKKLSEGRESARLSQQLATICCDVPLELSFEHFKLDLQACVTFFQQYELNSLVKKYQLVAETSTKVVDTMPMKLVEITSEEIVESLIKTLEDKKEAILYLDLSKGILSSLGLCSNENKAYWMSTMSMVSDDSVGLGPLFCSADKSLEKVCSRILALKELSWVAMDAKTIYTLAECFKIEFRPKVSVDLMLYDYLLLPDRSNRSIEKIARAYLSDDIHEDQNAGVKAVWMQQLLPLMKEKLTAHDLLGVYNELDFPMTTLLHDMQVTGICLDTVYLKKLSTEYHQRMNLLESSIYELAGETFNINSPKQLSTILFEKLQFTSVKKTKTGQSTDVDVLEKLAENHPIAQKLLEYRKIAKLLNTYIDPLPEMVDSQSRLHSSLNLTVAATGRLSSTDPNLQNIPVKTEDGEQIRRAFVAKEGCTLIVADYSQIELRILAHISQDEHLIQAFKDNLDIHTATAAAVFGVTLKEVTPAMRRRAKEVNFGVAYGMRAFGLAQRLKIPMSEASVFVDTYFTKYPRIKAYIDSSIAFVKEHGYINTLFGRKRFFPQYNSVSKLEQQGLDRMIINMPIQGTAADILKKAMLNLEQLLDSYKAKMLLQIHDELIFEAPEEEVSVILPLIQKCMESVVEYSVPLSVNIGVAKNWLEAK